MAEPDNPLRDTTGLLIEARSRAVARLRMLLPARCRVARAFE